MMIQNSQRSQSKLEMEQNKHVFESPGGERATTGECEGRISIRMSQALQKGHRINSMSVSESMKW